MDQPQAEGKQRRKDRAALQQRQTEPGRGEHPRYAGQQPGDPGGAQPSNQQKHRDARQPDVQEHEEIVHPTVDRS